MSSSHEIRDSFQVKLQWASNLDSLIPKSSALSGNCEKQSGRASNLLCFFHAISPSRHCIQRGIGPAPCLPPPLCLSWTSPNMFRTLPSQQRKAGDTGCFADPLAGLYLPTPSLVFTTGWESGSRWRSCQYRPGETHRKGLDLSSPGPYLPLSSPSTSPA